MRILAVIVTHNRKELLSRCLEYLKMQELAPDTILVINNDSSDGTLEMLVEGNIEHITQANSGSAGGWHAGISYAADNQYDACWLMDDDGFPDSKALQVLAKALSEDTACASSVVLKENAREAFVFPFPELNKGGFPAILKVRRRFFNLTEIQSSLVSNTYPFAHLFNGALLNMKIVSRVGNINRDYFLMGDEVDFFYRLKTAGKVVTHFHAKHFHPDVSMRPYSPEKIYYLVKNTIIINYLYLDFSLFRSVAVIPLVLYRACKRNGLRYLFTIVLGSRKKFLYQAIFRGFQGQLGNDHEQ
jgi:GT2 family glycosyltransferase